MRDFRPDLPAGVAELLLISGLKVRYLNLSMCWAITHGDRGDRIELGLVSLSARQEQWVDQIAEAVRRNNLRYGRRIQLGLSHERP